MPLKKTAKSNMSILSSDIFLESNLSDRENVRFIQNIAHSKGLPNSSILKLVHAIESQKLQISVKTLLIRCLIPKDFIAEDAFITMTGVLSDFSSDFNLKVEILKWMISVYSFVENPPLTRFECLYEIFLRLLDSENLRSYICHLLSLLTRKECITRRRIAHVVKLVRELGHEPCLVFLLNLYSKLQPQLLNFEGTLEGVSLECIFEPLGVYPNLIEKVHRSSAVNIPRLFVGDRYNCLSSTSKDNNPQNLDSFHCNIEELAIEEILMETHTMYGNSYSIQSQTNIPFEEIYRDIKSLKATSTIHDILNSDLRRLFLTSNSTINVLTSIFDYLLSSYYNSKDFSSGLPLLVEVIHEMQELNTATSDFIKLLIEFGDTCSNLETILELFSYQEICYFDKIGYKMDLLRETVFTVPVVQKCNILHCFSRIYQNWVLMEYDRYNHVSCEGNCSVSNENSSASFECLHLPENEICKLGTYIDLICDALISDDNFHPCLLNQVLLHYERVSYAHRRNNNLVIKLPTLPVFSTALFSLSSFTLDSLCRLFLMCGLEIKCMPANHPEAALARHYFETCFIDLLCIIWDGNSTPNGKTFLSKSQVYKRLKKLYPTFEHTFVFYRHPALLFKTMCFLEHNQLSTPSSLKDVSELHESYKAYLSKAGLKSLKDMITFLA